MKHGLIVQHDIHRSVIGNEIHANKHTNVLLTVKPVAGCLAFWVTQIHCGSESVMCNTQNLDPFNPKPPWIISCRGTLHLDTGPLQHMNSITLTLTLCPALCLSLSLALHSSFYRLCHHRRRGRACQFNPALISRHRLSVTRLILGSPFHFASLWSTGTMRQGVVDGYQCGPRHCGGRWI